MKKLTITFYQAIVALLIAGAVGGITADLLHDSKATSAESHTVFNYIKANDLSASLEERFNTINRDWPPSRNKLGTLLLDAQTEMALRTAK